jgi:hypothetical protein
MSAQNRETLLPVEASVESTEDFFIAWLEEVQISCGDRS